MRRRRRTDLEGARATAQDARLRRLYAEHRLHWLERLDQDEPAALAGAARQDQREIRDLYKQARACWPEDMPEGWEPPEQPVEIDRFHVTMALNAAANKGRQRPQTYRAGERLPDGRVVGQDQTETVMVDIGVEHGRALLTHAELESSPPAEPEPVPERAPPAKFTPEGIVSALTMGPGWFTGTLSPETGGERDPRQVGALGQMERD